MMAGGCAYFGRELAAAAGWTAGSYSASSGLGCVAQAQYFVHNDGGAPSAGGAAVPDEGSGVYGAIGGMDRRASFAGYVSGGGAPLPMATAAPARPPPLARANGPLLKASWTEEEDETLTEAVREHGNQHRKWTAIAEHLPGRTGKQCRERWVNHVDPTIEKKMWTEAEDMELIAAHRRCGNRWSAIARKLSRRSENSVKNHWNATKRSLKAKRTLKKRNCEQLPPGKLSLLADYIRNLYPATEWPPAVLPAVTAPPTKPDHKNQPVGPDTAIAAAPLAYAAPSMAGMYSTNMQHSWALDMNSAAAGYPYYIPAYPQLNYDLPYVPPPTQMIKVQDLQAAAAYASTNDVNPFADQQNCLQPEAEIDHGLSTNDKMGHLGGGGGGGGANGWCYFGTNGAGLSRSVSGGGPDDIDVVQMASREFEVQDQYMATLDHFTQFN